MKAVTGKRMAKLAEEKGWNLARINGSHHIYQGRSIGEGRYSNTRQEDTEDRIAEVSHEDYPLY